jgi:hypothetical protein
MTAEFVRVIAAPRALCPVPASNVPGERHTSGSNHAAQIEWRVQCQSWHELNGVNGRQRHYSNHSTAYSNHSALEWTQ